MVCMLYEVHDLRANKNAEVDLHTDAFVKYLDKSLQTPHSIFVSSLHIWPHFVFVFVLAKQIQADPLSILAASRYIRPHLLPTRVTAREQLPPKLPWTLVALVSTKISQKNTQAKYQIPRDTSKIPPIRGIGSTQSTTSRMIDMPDIYGGF